MKKHLHFFILLLTCVTITASAQLTKLSNNTNLLYGLPLNGKLLLISSDGSLWSTDGTPANTKKFTTKVLVNVDTSGAAILNNKLYFSGKTATGGTELWVTDGTDGGTSLVKDINPGAASSLPQNITLVGSTLYFSAIDGTHGNEFWKTDGSAGGTVMVKDINPGAAGSMDSSSWYVTGTTIFFTATDGTHGYEPWGSDGTAANTKLLKDIVPGSGGASYVGAFTTFNGKIIFFSITGSLFSGTSQIWQTDGTPTGTILLKDFGTFSGQSTIGYVNYKSKLYFGGIDATNTGMELWSTNGTPGGTALFKDLNPGVVGSTPFLNNGVIFPNNFMFSATTSGAGYELWTSDGTPGGTTMLKDINPGSSSASPFIFYNYSSGGALYNGKVFLMADDGTHGNELWITDGTAANTKLVKDVTPGSVGGMDNLSGYFYTTSGLYFGASDGSHGVELWKSDGTTAGTTMVKDINPGAGASNPRFIGVFNNHLILTADDGDNAAGNVDLYSVDATVTTLPVNLTSLTAVPVKEDVRVEWATATELNTSEFAIQRSTDGKQFESVGTVQAAGTTTTAHDYSFIDLGALHTTAPILFYRIQTNDKDGVKSYSAIVPVKVNGNAITATVFPNPASDFVIISYNMQNSNKATIRVTDASGKLVLIKALSNTGSNQTSIDVKTMPAGVYYVQFITDKGTQSTKFIKQP